MLGNLFLNLVKETKCKNILTLAYSLFSVALFAQNNPNDTARTHKEEDSIKYLHCRFRGKCKLEVGGMTFLPDDRLAVSTRRR